MGKDPVGVASHKGVLPHRQNRVKTFQEVKSLFLKGKNTEYAFNLVLKIHSAASFTLPTPSPCPPIPCTAHREERLLVFHSVSSHEFLFFFSFFFHLWPNMSYLVFSSQNKLHSLSKFPQGSPGSRLDYNLELTHVRD